MGTAIKHPVPDRV